MSRRDNQSQENKDIQLRLLKTVDTNFELDLITNLLKENDIPYILKDHGTGGYMRIISGSSIYGTDILVEELFFEKAKEILNSISLTE
ncbi:MAG: DUF2007 domain-containing protein [Tissierellia bacterium]|nr:DUF2007 domain-containing protein [Tissierellia bacterium]